MPDLTQEKLVENLIIHIDKQMTYAYESTDWRNLDSREINESFAQLKPWLWHETCKLRTSQPDEFGWLPASKRYWDAAFDEAKRRTYK